MGIQKKVKAIKNPRIPSFIFCEVHLGVGGLL